MTLAVIRNGLLWGPWGDGLGGVILAKAHFESYLETSNKLTLIRRRPLFSVLQTVQKANGF